MKNNNTLTIKTKLAPPLSKGNDVIERHQLLNILDKNRDKSLVLITAPAGYGKTTIMSQWHNSLNRQGVPTSWLTLDENDNDPSRLLHYLYCALAGKKKPSSSTNALQRTSNHSAYLASLLAEAKTPSVIFIDELEVLHNLSSIRLISMIGQHVLPGVQLVVASRQKVPYWTISKLKLNNNLVQLNEQDLKFSNLETNRLNTLNLSAPTNEAFTQMLTEKTEGWIAGIRLALLCLPRINDPQLWVQNISGEIDEITDFLSEEVFSNMQDEQRSLLLKCSILNRINASICESLTGHKSSQIHLESLVERGFFIQPTDEQRHWFRLHGLFRQFLLKRLDQTAHDDIPHLHSKAARWHDKHGDRLEAIAHALTAEEPEFAAVMLEGIAKQLLTQGQLTTLISLAKQLPYRLLARSPVLLITTCWAYLFLHRKEQAEQALKLLRKINIEKSIPEDWYSLYFTLETLLLVMNDDIVSAALLAEDKLKHIRDEDYFERGVISNIITLYHIGTNELKLAQQYILKARATHIESGSCFGLAYADTFSGLKQYKMGNIQQANDILKGVGNAPEYKAFPDPAITRQISKEVCIGFHVGVLYELNQLEQAKKLLDDKFYDAAHNSIPPDMVIVSCLTRARIAFAKGDMRSAYGYLEEGEVIGISLSLPRLVAEMRWERVTFAIRLADLESARSFAAQTNVSKMPTHPADFLHAADMFGSMKVSALRYAIHLESSDHVLNTLEALIPEAEETPVMELTMKILKAITHKLRANPADAHSNTIDAIDMGIKTGSIRRFLDEGPHAISLIKDVYMTLTTQSGILNSRRATYCKELLELAGDRQITEIENPQLLEELSDREIEILVLLEKGLKNEKIAEQLFLSINTVKWHLRRIYQKLDVSSRTKAIFKAKQLGLID